MRLLKLSFFIIVLATFSWSCQKEYSLEGSNVKLPAGSWQFNDSTKFFQGTMDTAYIDSSGSTKTLNLLGTSFTGGEFFSIILRSVDSFPVGTYSSVLAQSEFRYFTAAKDIYTADQVTGGLIVTITAIGSNKITGTFAGIAIDSSGNPKVITLGKFTSTIKLSGSGGSGIASGTLGATAGACTSVTPSGTYTQGVALTAANTVQVQVNVTNIGTYTISTNTINGVSFSKSGSFTATGVQSVTLTGTGTPVNSGIQNYAVTFGSSTCNFSITYGAGAGSATGALGATAGACTPATPAGTYTQGIALTAGNTVTIQVTVATVGTYTIGTPTVNGVSFTKSGTFTTTGVQNVVMVGSGTPVSSGLQTFTVSFSGTTCNFPITFAVGTTPNSDYFPLTANSFWTYDDTFSAPDTSYRECSSQATINGNTYRYIYSGSGPINSNTTDSTPYRKAGNNYFAYVSVDTFSHIIFDVPQHADLNFLRENATNGTTWSTPDYVGTFSGVAVKLKYTFVVTNANTSIVVNGVTYTNVIQMDWKSSEDFGGGYMDGFLFTTYYAKGIGIVKNTTTDALGGSPPSTLLLRHYQVF